MQFSSIYILHIDKIKKNEAKPFIIKNFINKKEIENFQKLYFTLPVEINNQRQNIIKKKWSNNFFPELQELYKNKLRSVLEECSMDNPKTKDGQESLGLFQESFKPVSLHVDSGFDFDKLKSFYLPETKATALRISRELGYEGCN